MIYRKKKLPKDLFPTFASQPNARYLELEAHLAIEKGLKRVTCVTDTITEEIKKVTLACQKGNNYYWVTGRGPTFHQAYKLALIGLYNECEQ
jgi:hypothetical protein